MIAILRKIRKELLKSQKISRYILYVMGELFLVVVGILLAIQINDWYQSKIENDKMKINLSNLKDDLENNIRLLKDIDTMYMQWQLKTQKGLELFHGNPSVDDFTKIDSLINTTYTTFKVFRSTYDEMLNQGIFYNLKNRSLRNQISSFYIEASNEQQAFLEINAECQDIIHGNPDLLPYDLLVYYLENLPEMIYSIDNSWISDPASPTYMAFMKRAIFYQKSSNTARRELISRFIKRAESLIESIKHEINALENE